MTAIFKETTTESGYRATLTSIINGVEIQDQIDVDFKITGRFFEEHKKEALAMLHKNHNLRIKCE